MKFEGDRKELKIGCWGIILYILPVISFSLGERFSTVVFLIAIPVLLIVVHDYQDRIKVMEEGRRRKLDDAWREGYTDGLLRAEKNKGDLEKELRDKIEKEHLENGRRLFRELGKYAHKPEEE